MGCPPSDVERGSAVIPMVGTQTEITASTNTPPHKEEPRSTSSTRDQISHDHHLFNLWNWITRKSGDGQPIDDSQPPDGGFQAWSVLTMAHLIGSITWGFINAFGVLQPFYVQFVNRSPSDVSWIGSVQAFFLLFVSAFSGRLTDAGYFHQTLAAGTILQLIGIFAASFSTQYWQLVICHGICMGIGGGLTFIPSMSLVATYFVKKRSFALAICVLGNSLGGLFFAVILQNTLPSIGYAWAMRVCGFVMLVVLVPANFLLKPRNIKRSTGPLVEWKAFTEPAYGYFAIGMFMSTLGQWVPVFYLGAFGRDVIGIDTKSAASLILIINGAGVTGRVLPAIIAPICGPLNLIVPLTFITAIILFSWAAVKDHKDVIIFDVFLGIFVAAAQGMLPPSLGSLTSDISKMGVRLGMVFSVIGFALLIGNPFAGYLISINGGGYLYAQMYAAATLAVGGLFLAASRYRVTGWKFAVRV